MASTAEIQSPPWTCTRRASDAARLAREHHHNVSPVASSTSPLTLVTAVTIREKRPAQSPVCSA